MQKLFAKGTVFRLSIVLNKTDKLSKFVLAATNWVYTDTLRKHLSLTVFGIALLQECQS